MTTFDQILPIATDVLEAHRPVVDALAWLLINRDLNGRVRFIAPETLAHTPSLRTQVETMYQALAMQLAPHAYPATHGILYESTPEESRQGVSAFPLEGFAQVQVVDRLATDTQWASIAEVAPGAPRIVFFSIKGGVGRSTALAASAWWLWLIVTAPRSPYRSLTHWTFGFTMLWLLATSLVLPWFDYGKTYRPVAQAIAQALPADHGCLAERGLSDTQLASLSYFVEIEPVAEDSKAGQACNWLLVVGDTRRELAPPSSRWNKVWEGNRPGDRREKFRLYRR